MRVISVFNHKGGVGKTTSVANLGAGLARQGKRVVLIDLDPQACLTVHFGIEPEDAQDTIYEVLVRNLDIARSVRTLEFEPGLELIPSNLDLAGAELELATAMGRDTLVREALDGYLRANTDIDYVIFDCPPSLGLLTVNALAASSEVFVPLQTEFLALRGVGKLLEVVSRVQRHLNPRIEITGILPTLSRTNTLLAREVQEEITKFFGPKVFTTRIRSNVRLAEAPGHGRSIFAYAPTSKGAADYAALAVEVDAMQVRPKFFPQREEFVAVDEIMAEIERPSAGAP